MLSVRPPTTRLQPCLSLLLSACLLSSVAGTAATRAADDPAAGDLEDARRSMRQMAAIDDMDTFAAAYLQWLARHHLQPLLGKGERVPLPAGAWIDVSDPRKIKLGTAKGAVRVEQDPEFIRGLSLRGAWTNVDAQPVAQLRAVVIKTVNLLFYIDLARGQMTPIPLEPR